jgi:hypothetical protein
MCKVPGCPFAHATHFCKCCGGKDVSHRSKDCPKQHCRVPGCSYAHAAHFCKSCGDKDASHRSADCPSGRRKATKPRGVYTMYHGTSGAAAASIEASGFRRSTGPHQMLGDGVYVTRDPAKAAPYSLKHGPGGVILVLKVDVGRVKRIDRQDHPLQKSWHDHGYDSAWVPPGCGMVASQLEENCVWDPSRIRVVGRYHGPVGGSGGGVVVVEWAWRLYQCRLHFLCWAWAWACWGHPGPGLGCLGL